jgi:hypothetical protein
MTCWVEVGDTFVWQEDYKVVQEGDTVEVECIRVDEDGVPWVDVINYRGEGEKVTAGDIQDKVERGLLERQ